MSHDVLSIRFFHKTVGDGCVNCSTRMLFTRSSAQPDTDVHCGIASGAGAVPPARRGRRPRRILGGDYSIRKEMSQDRADLAFGVWRRCPRSPWGARPGAGSGSARTTRNAHSARASGIGEVTIFRGLRTWSGTIPISKTHVSIRTERRRIASEYKYSRLSPGHSTPSRHAVPQRPPPGAARCSRRLSLLGAAPSAPRQVVTSQSPWSFVKLFSQRYGLLPRNRFLCLVDLTPLTGNLPQLVGRRPWAYREALARQFGRVYSVAGMFGVRLDMVVLAL